MSISIDGIKEDKIELLSQSKILFIEHNKSQIDFFRPIFKKYFKSVLVAQNDAEAIGMCHKNKFDIDIVLTSMDIQDSDSSCLIENIRKRVKNFSIPIVVLTEATDSNKLLVLLKKQINDIIVKPANEGTSLNILYKHLKNSHSQNLLNKASAEYRQLMEIVNETNLISETDIKGNIVYVNDVFSNISGYTKEELLSQPHNILRHPDMPKMMFEALWKTIQSGKLWTGKIKNRAKDGSSYWVKAYIYPIYEHGQICKFMGVRHLITDEVENAQKLKGYIATIKSQGVKQANVAKARSNALISEGKEVISLKDKLLYVAENLELEKQKNVQSNKQISHYEIEIKRAQESKNKAILAAKQKITHEYKLRVSKEKENNQVKLKLGILTSENEEIKERLKKDKIEIQKLLKRIDVLEDLIKHEK